MNENEILAAEAHHALMDDLFPNWEMRELDEEDRNEIDHFSVAFEGDYR